MKIHVIFFLAIFCISIAGAQTISEADSLVNNAREMEIVNNWQEAIDQYEEASRIYFFLGATEKLQEVYFSIGYIYGSKIGDWKKAESYWLKALGYSKDLIQKEEIARISKCLGVVYDNLGDYKKSETYYDDAIKYYVFLRDSLRIVQTYKNMGLLYFNQSRYEKADSLFSEALKSAEEQNYQEEIGGLKWNKGLVSEAQGNPGNAYKLYREALEILKNNKKDKANILNNLGIIYKSYGNLESAELHYEQALQLSEELGNEDLKSRVLNNLGSLSMKQKTFNKAFEYYQQSLKIKEESGNKKGEATTLLNIGGYYLELGNYEEAENYYNESFAISKDLSHIYGLATTWMRFGNLANLQNDHTKADTLYNKAMDLAQKIISSDLIYKLYYRKALNYIAINNNDDAYENLFKSIEIIEEIRYEIRVEEDRSSFMKNKLPIYKTMIELLMQMGEVDASFEYYEKMKARNLLDLLDGGFLVFETEMTETEKLRQIEIENQLKETNNKLINYCAYDVSQKRTLDTLLVKRENIRQEFKNFEEGILLKHPQLSKKMGQGDPLNIKEIRKLLNNNEVALCYLTMDEDIICYVLKREGRIGIEVNYFKIDISKTELKDLVETTLSSFESETLENLYQELIKPVEEFIDDQNRLCIITESFLSSLPFQALLNPETGEYLIQEYTLYYNYSLSVLDELRGIGTSGKSNVLALGNPYFGEKGVNYVDKNFSSLPSTNDEVLAIKELYQEKARVLLEKEATETRFKEEATDYGILHFATHGMLDEVNPMYSALLLTADSQNDGFLTAKEIMKMEISADMVVLSACETAKGNLLEGEGMLGLSRAFFSAYVPTVVASLWPVEDVSTKLLMQQFYMNLKNHDNPAQALKKAQIYLMNIPEYNNPKYWAPFIVIGDTE